MLAKGDSDRRAASIALTWGHRWTPGVSRQLGRGHAEGRSGRGRRAPLLLMRRLSWRLVRRIQTVGQTSRMKLLLGASVRRAK